MSKRTPLSTSTPVRLQKYLATCGVTSRRNAESLITSGVVTVNGVVVHTLGTKVIPGKDKVMLRGKVLVPESKRLFVFHKPAGVLSALGDASTRKTISDFVSHLPVRVFPVGRLDYDVTGLLLLTNDGDLAQSLLHPRYGVERVYWAVVKGEVGTEKLNSSLKKLLSGVQLERERVSVRRIKTLTWSKRAERLVGHRKQKQVLLEVTVARGEKHFVKNILAAVGLPVVKLCRVGFGKYHLGTLKVGQLREV